MKRVKQNIEEGERQGLSISRRSQHASQEAASHSDKKPFNTSVVEV